LVLPEGVDVEREYETVRDQVLSALDASLWKPLEPQPVSLPIELADAYQFECDLNLAEMEKLLKNSGLWYWEALPNSPPQTYVGGRIPFQMGGQVDWNYRKVHIEEEDPGYRIFVGRWVDSPDRTPTCREVHDTVLGTILPALGARQVRAAGTLS
jgi:hypothetical protein